MENNSYNLEYIPINELSINKDNHSDTNNQSANQSHDANNTSTQNSNETDRNPNLIELLDGSVIQGYTIENAPKAEHWKGMKLDSTGQYFIISGKKRKQMNPREAEAVEAEKFFLEHAFFFLANAKRILSDSRMFLAPVPVHSGIAYTGTSGFTAPTLGVYIEWWLNTPISLVQKKGRKFLTWHIAGSPLSGSNHCSIVDEDGKTQTHSFCGFSKLWSSFVNINTRYHPYKGRYEAYTLEKAYKLLGGDDENGNGTLDNKDKEKRSLIVDCFFLRGQCESLAVELSKKEKEVDTLREELTRTRIQSNEEVLAQVYQQYLSKKESVETRREELLAQRAELRKSLRSCEITSKEFQSLVGPINKEIDENKYSSFNEFDYLPNQYKVHLGDIIEFFKAKEGALDQESPKDEPSFKN